MASKSILNRLLVVQSYFPQFQIDGDSTADDVSLMKKALSDLKSGRPMQAGFAGTVLRFMALRASREPGRHVIQGHPRLFQRPQQELVKILNQLGVQATLSEDSLTMESQGWKLQGDTLLVPFDRSSQFASAVLLNAWNLPFDLYVASGQQKVSQSYWRMTTRLMQQLGMTIDFWDQDFRVPHGQTLKVGHISCEIDVSSAFAIAAVAAVSGSAVLLDFPAESLQPDAVFVSILQSMGVPIHRLDSKLKVEKAIRLNGVRVNLGMAPDLFPVLAALCALADGESELYGAPQLVYKESNRLLRMSELLRQFGRRTELLPEGLKILGNPPVLSTSKIIVDCDHDHRLAFAAAVFKAAGFNVEIRGADAVDKSYPQFWSALGWKL